MDLKALTQNSEVVFNTSIDGVEISGITSSSNDVVAGSLFVTLKGFIFLSPS